MRKVAHGLHREGWRRVWRLRGKDGADPRKTAARHPNWSGKLILESATPRGAGKAANQRGTMRESRETRRRIREKKLVLM